jgi:hypothetical protein
MKLYDFGKGDGIELSLSSVSLHSLLLIKHTFPQHILCMCLGSQVQLCKVFRVVCETLTHRNLKENFVIDADNKTNMPQRKQMTFSVPRSYDRDIRFSFLFSSFNDKDF